MQKVDKEKTRYYLAKIHILFRGNFRTQAVYTKDSRLAAGLPVPVESAVESGENRNGNYSRINNIRL